MDHVIPSNSGKKEEEENVAKNESKKGMNIFAKKF